MTLAERYLALAFRVGKHEPDLVENYYGPREAVAAVEAEEPLEPARLVEEAESLLADLKRGDLEAQRSAWIAGQTRSLLTVARRLDGEHFSYADEVEGTFGMTKVSSRGRTLCSTRRFRAPATFAPATRAGSNRRSSRPIGFCGHSSR